VSVDAGVADPAATTALWTEILGFGPVEKHSFDLGGRLVRLVNRAIHPRWTLTLRRSALGADLTDGEFLGAQFRYI
jgi:catechol 2,3-dioxygenase-like lactoylglutathione lyase family enzyme